MIDEKQLAGYESAKWVQDGMVVGLGTGSTAAYMIKALGERVQNGLKIQGVPTSLVTAQLAKEAGIPLLEIGQVKSIDLTIDGVDEVDGSFSAIKGGGAALFREKVLACMSHKNIWIMDSSKQVEHLGKFPLPVEVLPFAEKWVQAQLEEKGYRPVLRMKGEGPWVTDNHNHILDLHGIYPLQDVCGLATYLDSLTGVCEHGLFVHLGDMLIVGTQEGVRRAMKNEK